MVLLMLALATVFFAAAAGVYAQWSEARMDRRFDELISEIKRITDGVWDRGGG